jgi:hypothetical protein
MLTDTCGRKPVPSLSTRQIDNHSGPSKLLSVFQRITRIYTDFSLCRRLCVCVFAVLGTGSFCRRDAVLVQVGSYPVVVVVVVVVVGEGGRPKKKGAKSPLFVRPISETRNRNKYIK